FLLSYAISLRIPWERASKNDEQQNSKIQPLSQDSTLPAIPDNPNGKYAGKREKVTFYLTSEQADKLEELAYQHRKIKGKRINRNDIVRHLIDQCSIEWLKDL
ncbi:MAG: hypothetical protein WCD86_15890, partial [Ktedonobacteraceae bacterium]